MDQLVIGKELPNLKITLAGLDSNKSTISDDVMEVEEVEEKVDDENKVDVKLEFMSYKGMKKYENKSGLFVSKLDLTSEAAQEKLQKRAERFQIECRPKNKITQDDIDALYKSLKINVDAKSSTEKNRGIRLDAIHIRGVTDMSTEDIFTYFGEYSASSIEWINDISCNVIWSDETSAAHALLGLSRPLILCPRKKIIEIKEEAEETEKNKPENGEKMEEGEEVMVMSDDESSEDEIVIEKDNSIQQVDEDIIVVKNEEKIEIDPLVTTDNKVEASDLDADDLSIPIPPGQWRIGVPHPKSKALLVRFATKEDRKIRGAEKRSVYYKKYGNPNYGGLKGLISNSRKRRFWQMQQKRELEQLGVKNDDVFSNDNNNNNDDDDDKEDRVTSSESEKAPSESGEKPENSTSKKFRMKMYADEEEIKRKKKRRVPLKQNRKRVPSEIRRRPSSVIHKRYDKSENLRTNKEREMVSDRLNQSNLSVWDRLTDRREDNSDDSDYSQSSPDLRRKLSRIADKSEWTRSVTPVMGDLRSKLDQIRKKRNVEKHRSPLLIQVPNEQSD